MGKTMQGLLVIIMICGLACEAGAEIIFEEDFNDGTADGFTEDCDLWSVTPSGRYTIDLYGNEVFSWSFIGGSAWTDYTFSLDVRSKDSKNHIAAVRVQENGDCYIINMRSRPFNDIVLTKYIGGEFHNLLFLPARVNGEWQKISVRVVGSTIIASESGTELLKYHDTEEPLLAGGAAVVALAGGLVRHQELFVDNIRVESLEVKTIVPIEDTTWSHLKALSR